MATMSRAQEYARQAKRHYEKGDFWAAVSEYDKAINLGDRSISTYDGKAAAMSKVEVKDGVVFSAAADASSIPGPSTSTSASARRGLKGSALEVAEKMCDMFAKDKAVYRAWYRKAAILFAMNLHPSCLQTLDHASHILSQAAGLSETEVSRATANIDSLRSKAIVARRLGTLKRMDAESDRQRSEADEKRRKIEYEENRRRLQALEELIAEKAKNNYIHLLPRDVVIMICQTGMERGDSALQVKMAAVNKQWREWINSDAGLWQTLKLGQKKPIVKTRLWMERSQGRLRRLIIDPKFDREHFPALRAELGSNAAEHLDALEVQQHVFKDVRLGFQKFFRNLRHLTLAFDERSRSERDRSIPDLLAEPDEVENRQPLQELVVEGPLPMLLPPAGSLHMAELRNCDRLQWATIRKLYLKHFAVVRPAAWGARSLGFLGRMRDVEEIGLVSVVDYPEAGHVLDQQETDHAPVVLARLWRYTEQDRRGITRCPFSTISTPNLTHLALCNFRGNVWHSLIDTNLYRVLPNLVYLDVSNNCLLEHRLLEVIHHTTSLRYLGVSGCPVGPAFLEALIRTDNEEDSLLPNLTALSIGCNEELPGVLLKDVVISRLPRHLKGSLQKKLQTAQKAPEPPKIRSAFAPKLSSKVKQQPASVAPPSTQTTAANTDKPDLARLTWLCLDGCNGLDAELVGALQKRVRTVLWSSAAKDEDRLRGQGRYAWDAEYGTDCTSDCHLRRTPGTDTWFVHHMCGPRYEEGLAASQDLHRRRETSDRTLQSDRSLGLGEIADMADWERRAKLAQRV